MSDRTEHYEILRKLVFTEKSSGQQERSNAYTFRVADGANKIQIREAVEKLFGVKVVKVRTQNVPGKIRRLGGVQGRTTGWKKAIVTLKEGDAIQLA